MKVIENGKYREMSEEEIDNSLPLPQNELSVEELLERIRILEEKQNKGANENEAK
jgi:hypothetical protein